MSKPKITIAINVKPSWKASRGHTSYRGGGGTHVNRPRKQRTRMAQKNKAIRDFS